jgi:DNA polymerase III subunit delta
MNYLIIGSDDFQVSQKVNEITKEYLASPDDFNYSVHNGAGINWSLLIDDAMTFPFDSEYKVIVIENADFLSAGGSIIPNDEKLLSDYFEAPNLATVLIFCANKGYDSRKSFVKKLEKVCHIIKLEALNDREFRKIVIEDLKNHQLVVENRAFDVMMNRLPIDIMIWKQELQKLLLCRSPIDLETIEALISRSINDDVFKMVRAIMDNNLKLSLQLYYDMLANSIDPIQIIGAIGSNLRSIYQVKVLMEHRINDFEISKRLNFSEYRLRAIKEHIRNANPDNVLQYLADLSILDYRFKNQTCDRKLELELFIIRLMEDRYAVN